ncbi:acidic repeat-containing protein [Cebus imitator]|uniref:acidic repeat-containing protein n=1 Tax=Cebus imitator TaxID=2715852 RepID=UPI001896A59C|nr:acidic repeat-containing protein [Cebus imitator]
MSLVLSSGFLKKVYLCLTDMDPYEEELRCLQDPVEDEDCYILNVQSSSDGASGSSVARAAPKRQATSVVVIDSDSDNECYPSEKKAKILKTNHDGKDMERYNVKPTIQGPLIVISDDDDDDDDKKSNDFEVHSNKSNDSEVPKDKSDDSEVPKDKSDDSEVPKDKSDDSEVPKDKSDDSDVPKSDSHDSDVPDDNDNHDSDVPDDDDNHDSDVPDDDHDSDVPDDDDDSPDSDVPDDDDSPDSDVPDDDDSHDSDVPDDDDNHDSDVPDDDHDSDVPDDDDGHDSDVPDEDSNDSDVPNDSNDWEVPDNNSDDLEVPVPAEEDLCDESQIASDEEELDEAGEQDLGENLCGPLSDPEANLEVSKRKLPTEVEPAPGVEQSGKRKAKSETILEPLKQQKAKTESIVEPLRKRKAKTKNVPMTPADKGHKKCGHSKKKPGAAKVENRKTRTCKCKVHGSFLHGLGKSKKYSRIYDLFNRTDCDKKLQEKRWIAWNNKVLKTPGPCSTGEMPYQNRQCFAEIQIGMKISAKIQIGMQLSTELAATPNHWIPGVSFMSSSRRVWSWCR